jgi:hypothetical protein
MSTKKMLTYAAVGVGAYFAWTKVVQPMLATPAKK